MPINAKMVRGAFPGARQALRSGIAATLLLCPAVSSSAEPGTLARLAALLDVPAGETSCQELPPTPSPAGDAGPLTQCITTSEGIQFVTIRTKDGRVVWLDYTGPWQRGAARPATWDAMLATLQRAFGRAQGPRAHCRLWSLGDGDVRAALHGSSDGDDGVVRLLRTTVSGADTKGALGC